MICTSTIRKRILTCRQLLGYLGRACGAVPRYCDLEEKRRCSLYRPENRLREGGREGGGTTGGVGQSFDTKFPTLLLF